MAHYHAGGVLLPNSPVMVGAGACKTPQTTEGWLSVAPVVSGSYTPEERGGNEGERLFYPDTEAEFRELGFGLNSFGMPNMGFAATARRLANYEGEEPQIVSIAGFCVDDYIAGARQFTSVASVLAREFNFGCPNTEHGKIMSFDLHALEMLFQQLNKIGGPPVWVKFSPYSDPGLLKEVATVVNAAPPVVKAVVTCNTFANAYAGEDAISPMGGLAGLSGPALKPIALGQVVQFRKHLDSRIDVIGIGGATMGNDVIDFLDAGAQAMQMTSLPFWLGNPRRFWETLLNAETGDRLEAYLNTEH